VECLPNKPVVETVFQLFISLLVLCTIIGSFSSTPVMGTRSKDRIRCSGTVSPETAVFSARCDVLTAVLMEIEVFWRFSVVRGKLGSVHFHLSRFDCIFVLMYFNVRDTVSNCMGHSPI
jgi:hypothetical protein